MHASIRPSPPTAGLVSRLARAAAAALLVAVMVAPAPADARPGRGLSQGSRGVNTYKAPPSTQTAPGTAQPMQRSAQPETGVAGAATARPGVGGAATAGAAQPSRFGGGFMAGLLGAGLIGGLLGAGFFGGLTGITAFLGLLLQVLLIAGLVYLAFAFFRSRRQPAAVGPQDAARQDMSGRSYGPVGNAGPNAGGRPGMPAGGSRIGSGIGSGLGTAAAAPVATPLTIDGPDYASFERLLSVVQLAYGREDRDALRAAVTPEMLGYFAEELDANAAQGVRNVLGEPTLLSGDLAEAWSEPSGEYATVAMRYALTDATLDRRTGAVVSGSTSEPEEVTEVWTFVRRHDSGPAAWRLSAIQQTA